MIRRISTFALSLAALSILALPAAVRAASPQRLGDLYSGPGATPSSFPRNWIEAGERTFFIASLGNSGRDVFVTEGSPETTHLLVDASPGDLRSSPELYGVVGGRLLWWASTDETSSTLRSEPGKLWASDGTPGGTLNLLPLGVVVPRQLMNFALANDALYFVGCDSDGCSIWTSDGTPAGTHALQLLTDPLSQGSLEMAATREGGRLFYRRGRTLWTLDPGGEARQLLGEGDLGDSPTHLTTVGEDLFFFTSSGGDPLSVWVSDGTVAGTHKASDLPGEARDYDGGSKAAGGLFYFSVRNQTDGIEIWRTDGAPQGTVPVTAFDFFFALSPLDFDETVAIVGQRVYSLASDEESNTSRSLWVSDGTPGTTRDLLLCGAGCPTVTSPLAVAGQRVVFTRDHDGGLELVSSDGTVQGTGVIAALCDAPCASHDVTFSEHGDEVGFLAGGRAWISDGTAQGTRPITAPGMPETPDEGEVGRVGNCWLFPGRDERGTEPWCSEGSPASARIVKDLSSSTGSSDPRELTAVSGSTVFSARDATGVRQVWSSNGTPGSTRALTGSLDALDDQRHLFSAGSFAVFYELGGRDGLWRTDGTEQGTFPIGDANFDFASLVSYRGVIYMFNLIHHEVGFWRIDGTAAGPELVVPFPTISGISPVPRVVDDAIYFIRPDDGQLWRTDGTIDGTWKVSSLPQPTTPDPRSLVKLDGLYYFVAGSAAGGSEIWRTDGSPDSAERVVTIPDPLPGGTERPGRVLFVYRGAIYFGTQAYNPRREALLRYTPSSGLSEIISAIGEPEPMLFTELNGTLYFRFDDGLHGQELWRTEGSPESTSMVADVNPAGGSLPAELTVAGNRLFFVATTAKTGRELWALDADGTLELVEDLVPGPSSSAPSDLALVGSSLFFAADDGATGREPWVLTDATDGPPAEPPGPSLTTPEIPAFRFKVRITSQAGASLIGRREPACIPETLCVSGAVAGRSEVFLRVVGPKPNGYLWPTLVKFTTSRVEVWIEQTSTGQLRYYDLAAAAPGFDELPGLFDREGFLP